MINVIKPTQVHSVITSSTRNYDGKIICECFDIIFKDSKLSLIKTKNYPELSRDDKGTLEQILHKTMWKPLTSDLIRQLADQIQDI